MRQLVRRNTNVPSWVPVVVVVVTLAWLSMKVMGTSSGGSSSRRGFGHQDDNDDRAGGSSSSRRDGGGGDSGDDSDAAGSGNVQDIGSGGAGDGGGNATAEDDEVDDEEDYVVLTAEEIGPAIRSACASAGFQECCAEVRKGWAILQPNHVEATCARMYDIFREKDPVAAALIGERVPWNEQQRTFTVMMSTIIAKSADPALLEETLRPLGERHFARGVKETYFESMGQALLQAVAETLRKRERSENAFPPSAAAAWDAFFATVAGCMLLAGDGMAPRPHYLRRRRKGSQREPAVDVPITGSLTTNSAENGGRYESMPSEQSMNRPESRPGDGERTTVSVGWERQDGQPTYSLIRSSWKLRPPAADMPRFPQKPAGGVEAVEGGNGIRFL